MTTVWVTGAKGFIGRHLVKTLAKSGVSVAGIDNSAWTDKEAAECGLSYCVNGDVSFTNLEQLAHKSGTPSQIFHLAGGSSVGLSLNTPEKDFKLSVDSTSQVLEWARNNAPQSRLVLTSSAAVYGDKHSKPIKESDFTEPFSPYGYHKRMAELLFESYSRNFGLHTAIVRLFSVYGPGLRKQLLWDLCTQLKDKPLRVTLSGSGQEERDWIHVQDAVDYLIKSAGFATTRGFAVNGSSGIAVTVREITELVCDVLEIDTQIIFNGISRPGDPRYLVADTQFAISLGLSPKINWRPGIKEYVEWFQHTERNKMS
jgi:UDP-glucose 4-epimerase